MTDRFLTEATATDSENYLSQIEMYFQLSSWVTLSGSPTNTPWILQAGSASSVSGTTPIIEITNVGNSITFYGRRFSATGDQSTGYVIGSVSGLFNFAINEYSFTTNKISSGAPFYFGRSSLQSQWYRQGIQIGFADTISSGGQIQSGYTEDLPQGNSWRTSNTSSSSSIKGNFFTDSANSTSNVTDPISGLPIPATYWRKYVTGEYAGPPSFVLAGGAGHPLGSPVVMSDGTQYRTTSNAFIQVGSPTGDPVNVGPTITDYFVNGGSYTSLINLVTLIRDNLLIAGWVVVSGDPSTNDLIMSTGSVGDISGIRPIVEITQDGNTVLFQGREGTATGPASGQASTASIIPSSAQFWLAFNEVAFVFGTNGANTDSFYFGRPQQPSQWYTDNRYPHNILFGEMSTVTSGTYEPKVQRTYQLGLSWEDSVGGVASAMFGNPFTSGLDTLNSPIDAVTGGPIIGPYYRRFDSSFQGTPFYCATGLGGSPAHSNHTASDGSQYRYFTNSAFRVSNG